MALAYFLLVPDAPGKFVAELQAHLGSIEVDDSSTSPTVHALYRPKQPLFSASGYAQTMRVDLGPESGVAEGRPTCVTADGKPYALFKVQGKVFCTDNRCTHVGGPLCRGTLNAFIVTCPLHGSRFDVRTGQVVGGPASNPVRAYSVTAESGRLWADIP